MSHEHDPVTLPAEWSASASAAVGLRVTLSDGRSVVSAQRKLIVGRGAGCDLSVADPMVSSFHVELSVDPSGVHVRDLESRNGSWYGGAKLRDAVVPSGATLQIGSSPLRVEVTSVTESPPPQGAAFQALSGASAALREAAVALSRLARTELSVLLQGETGTGKELAARGLHAESPRAQGPFVVLDCAALPPTLAESVLFGHERGAFTGAHDTRPGLFEQAHGGTIFLDEIGELPIDLQPKLLRVLERREVTRVGNTQPFPVSVRVISATWRDLRVMINRGTFREDLYYRVAQARVVLPPLRERREDVPLLVQRFLAGLDRGAPCARAILPEALDELARRDYPGNVRELRNTVERAALLAAGGVITLADLAFERMIGGGQGRGAPQPTARPSAAPDGELAPFKQAKQSLVDDFEKDYLTRLLTKTGNNLSRASSLAGIERNHLRDLCRKHGVRSSE